VREIIEYFEQMLTFLFNRLTYLLSPP
jgi:hypothetical protein